jgi:hypothetical protein
MLHVDGCGCFYLKLKLLHFQSTTKYRVSYRRSPYSYPWILHSFGYIACINAASMNEKQDKVVFVTSVHKSKDSETAHHTP